MYLAETIAHYLYPRRSNDHKAKALHPSSLLIVLVFFVILQILLQTFPLSGVKILGYAANISPAQVISLTNQKREAVGLSPLLYDSVLAEAAREKGEHMLEHDYWAHVAPDGTEPWIFFTNEGYHYRYAGENLARDFSNPEAIVEAWMASPSHKENLLSDKYNEIGIAVVEGDLGGVETTIIVQLFGTRLSATAQIPVTQAKPQASSTSEEPQPAIPTAVPLIAKVTPIQSTSGEQITKPSDPITKEATGLRLLISPFNTTRSISLLTIALLLVIMVIDGVVVARRKLSRVSGRPFAHIAFMGMILGLILIAKAGQIL